MQKSVERINKKAKSEMKIYKLRLQIKHRRGFFFPGKKNNF